MPSDSNELALTTFGELEVKVTFEELLKEKDVFIGNCLFVLERGHFFSGQISDIRADGGGILIDTTWTAGGGYLEKWNAVETRPFSIPEGATIERHSDGSVEFSANRLIVLFNSKSAKKKLDPTTVIGLDFTVAYNVKWPSLSFFDTLPSEVVVFRRSVLDMLCRNCTILKWLVGSMGYENMPYRFEYNGVVLDWRPDLRDFHIGRLQFKATNDVETLKKIADVVMAGADYGLVIDGE